MRGFLTFASTAPLNAVFQRASFEIVGSVLEGELVHVITRAKIGSVDKSITQMEVISFKKEGDAWRVMLTGSMKGLAQALRKKPD